MNNFTFQTLLTLIKPYNEALILLAHAAQISKEEIIRNYDQIPNDKVIKKYKKYIDRRKNKEPIAYITESKEFWSLNFYVSKDTLIPRPDSEILIETVLELSKGKELTILDCGTGSGCLLLSLLYELKRAKGIGIDISAKAIVIAKKNAKNLNLEARVDFINTSWNDFNEEKFDIIISNPPYLNKNDIQNLQDEVKFEPLNALIAGEDGLDCYREIIKLIPKFTQKHSLCFFEIGYGQSTQICDLLEKENYKIEKIKHDLANIPRVIAFSKK
jgi:release factor glutamine methyltransferase